VFRAHLGIDEPVAAVGDRNRWGAVLRHGIDPVAFTIDRVDRHLFHPGLGAVEIEHAHFVVLADADQAILGPARGERIGLS